MENDTLSLLVVAAAIIVVIFIFISIAVNLRKYGASLTHTMFASTYEFLNKDMRDAAEEMVQMNAGKNIEKEESDKIEGD